MSRRAAARSRGWPEFGAGLAGVGGLEDFAAAACVRVVARGFSARAVGQGFRAVHFVEVGFVDTRAAAGTTRGLPLIPTFSP